MIQYTDDTVAKGTGFRISPKFEFEPHDSKAFYLSFIIYKMGDDNSWLIRVLRKLREIIFSAWAGWLVVTIQSLVK